MLRGIKQSAQVSQLLLDGLQSAPRGVLSLPGNTAEPVQHLAEFVVSKLERRCGQEEHPFKNALKLTAKFTGILLGLLILEQ